MEVYKLIHVAGKPLHTWLYSKTNEPVKVISKYFDSTTGAVLDVNSKEVAEIAINIIYSVENFKMRSFNSKGFHLHRCGWT